jgi:hypothetical protein
MHKKFLTALWIIPFLCALPAQGAQKIKNIKIAVSNPGDHPRNAADIVIPIAQIRTIAPDFTPGALIVTASDASTPEQDASILQTEELPSQVDDLDGDGKGDELAFQVDLGPHQTRIVTVSYGDQERISRLRSDYQQRTAALFSRKIEGLGWESERVAFRVYFDSRNAIDLYGKRRPSLQLAMYAAPDYTYHDESPEGRDIYKVGDAIGIGAVAGLVDGKVIQSPKLKTGNGESLRVDRYGPWWNWNTMAGTLAEKSSTCARESRSGPENEASRTRFLRTPRMTSSS